MISYAGMNLLVEPHVLISLFGHDLSENRLPSFRIMLLERQQHVHHLLTVTRLLHVGELAVAAIGDAGLRDLA
jgi:hypothetical protein